MFYFDFELLFMMIKFFIKVNTLLILIKYIDFSFFKYYINEETIINIFKRLVFNFILILWFYLNSKAGEAVIISSNALTFI